MSNRSQKRVWGMTLLTTTMVIALVTLTSCVPTPSAKPAQVQEESHTSTTITPESVAELMESGSCTVLSSLGRGAYTAVREQGVTASQLVKKMEAYAQTQLCLGQQFNRLHLMDGMRVVQEAARTKHLTANMYGNAVLYECACALKKEREAATRFSLGECELTEEEILPLSPESTTK